MSKWGYVDELSAGGYNVCDICKEETESIEGYYILESSAQGRRIICPECYIRGMLWAIKEACKENSGR